MSTTTPTAPHSSPRPTFTRPSLARLSAAEVRKVLDTRAGRWSLLTIAALELLALGTYLAQTDGPLVLTDALATPTDVLRLLLPALGVLSMTGEWTQRTALTTFALVPQRGRVLAAKLIALLTVTLAAGLATAAVCAVGVTATSALTGQPTDLSNPVAGTGQVLVVVALWMLMGAAFGALLHSTAAALVAFLVLPVAVSAAVVLTLGADPAAWVNVVSAINDTSDLHLDPPLAPPFTALTLWIVLPLLAGTVRTLQRQVN